MSNFIFFQVHHILPHSLLPSPRHGLYIWLFLSSRHLSWHDLDSPDSSSPQTIPYVRSDHFQTDLIFSEILLQLTDSVPGYKPDSYEDRWRSFSIIWRSVSLTSQSYSSARISRPSMDLSSSPNQYICCPIRSGNMKYVENS